MAFKNRVRLPFYLRQAQFPVDQKGFRLYDGTMKNTSSVVRKIYQAITDQLPEDMHEKLVIALSHDEVTIEGARYAGQVAKEGDYQINWQDFLDYPLADANFAVQVTPYDMTNNNCGSCEDLQQIELVDDDAGTFSAGGEFATVETYENDSICCFPATLSIVFINEVYLASAEIWPDQVTYPGRIVLTTLAECPDGTDVILATYRVTCEDGSYDEANIIGDIIGNIEACLAPTNLIYTHIDETEISAESDEVAFDASASVPFSYQWQLYSCDNLGTPIDTGTVTDSPITFLGLDPATCYVVSIRSVCDEEGTVFSEWTSLEFTTASGASAGLCGRFSVAGFDGSKPASFPLFFTYMNCLGEMQNGMVPNMTSKFDCFLVDGSNNPIYFSGSAYTTYSYVEPC